MVIVTIEDEYVPDAERRRLFRSVTNLIIR